MSARAGFNGEGGVVGADDDNLVPRSPVLVRVKKLSFAAYGARRRISPPE
jgi:hypothetical protein